MRALTQQSALIFSAASAGVFSVTGIVLGLMSGSVMILFDSAYSLLSLGLAGLSLWALRLAKRPASTEYPFGRLTIEPLSILVKGLVIGAVCVISIAISVRSLWQGGQVVDLNLALIFSTLNLFGCAITWWVLRQAQRAKSTPLINAEVSQWLMDTWLSAAVLLGFLVAQLIAWSRWSELAVYADPVMVLLIAGYFCYIPIQMVRRAMRQLLFAGPDTEVQQRVNAAVAGCERRFLRTAQVGSVLIFQHDGGAWSKSLRNTLTEVASGLNMRPMFITPDGNGVDGVRPQESNHGVKNNQPE